MTHRIGTGTALAAALWCPAFAGAQEIGAERFGPGLVQAGPTDIVPGTELGPDTEIAALRADAQFADAAAAPAGPTWAQYQELLKRVEATEKKLAAPPKPAGSTFPNFRVSGFFQLDAGAFAQDDASRATVGDIQNGVGFRRARLAALGSVAEHTNYSMEFDFGVAGRPSFTDVWVEQTHLPTFGNIRIGQFKEPFGVEALTSVRRITFLERSLPFQAFVPFRRVGIMAYDKADDELTQWAYGLFRSGGFLNSAVGDSRFAEDIGDDGGISLVGRTSHLLWYDEPAEGRYLFHLGGSCMYTRLPGGTATGNLYQARVIPEFFVGDPAGGGLTSVGTPFMADTGRIPAKQFSMFGLEAIGQYGAAHFQAEYLGVMVDQINGSTLYYDGAVVQAGWFLTGENLTYNKTRGAMDKVVPFTEFFGLGRKSCMGGWGAWEVTGRWSFVDLDRAGANPLPPAAVTIPSVNNPGRLTDTTLGLNWYWNTYTKVQANWIHCFLDSRTFGKSDTDVFAGRVQLEF